MESKLVLSKQWFIDSHQGNIKDVYHFKERLGSGGFGVVYLAEDRKTSKSATHLCIEQSSEMARHFNVSPLPSCCQRLV